MVYTIIEQLIQLLGVELPTLTHIILIEGLLIEALLDVVAIQGTGDGFLAIQRGCHHHDIVDLVLDLPRVLVQVPFVHVLFVKIFIQPHQESTSRDKIGSATRHPSWT